MYLCVCVFLGWFGMRRDFCVFLLDTCPCLREYGNVSYKFGSSNSGTNVGNDARRTERESAVLMQIRPDDGQSSSTIAAQQQRQPYLRPILPTITIESPD